MAIRNWKDIPLFKGVTDEQWNDWHWQVEHRLTTVEEIAQVVNLSKGRYRKGYGRLQSRHHSLLCFPDGSG